MDKMKKLMCASYIIIALIGIVLILVAILIGTWRTMSVIMLSVGASILSSAIVGKVSSYFEQQHGEALQMMNKWGIEKIYETRAEINAETNHLLTDTLRLDICAMGLKGFRDAQGDIIKQRVKEGMRVRILTLSPRSKFLSMIDGSEGVAMGSTKASINTLLPWVKELQKEQIEDNQVQIRTYDHYPYDFYFCMDGTVFTGPYQNKTSQQTITYKYAAKALGAMTYKKNFENLWENSSEYN